MILIIIINFNNHRIESSCSYVCHVIVFCHNIMLQCTLYNLVIGICCGYFTVIAYNADTSFNVCFFWVMNKIDEVWQQIPWRGIIGMVDRKGLVHTTTQTGDLWPRVSIWEGKILKGVKNIFNAFFQGGFTDLDEIWHDGGALGNSRS